MAGGPWLGQEWFGVLKGYFGNYWLFFGTLTIILLEDWYPLAFGGNLWCCVCAMDPPHRVKTSSSSSVQLGRSQISIAGGFLTRGIKRNSGHDWIKRPRRALLSPMHRCTFEVALLMKSFIHFLLDTCKCNWMKPLFTFALSSNWKQHKSGGNSFDKSQCSI